MNAQEEENQLAKSRNVALDVLATSHMIKSFISGEKSWECKCGACDYLRMSPRLVQVLAKKIVEEYGKKES